MYAIRSLIVLAFLSLALPAHSQTPTKGSNCDQSERTKALLKVYDFNGDGCLDAEEMRVVQRDLQIVQSRPKDPTKPPAPPPGPPRDNNIKTTLIVRDAYAANAFIAGGQKLSDAGALFSYTRDNIKFQETWVGKGAVMLAIHGDTNITFGGDPNSPRITYFGFIPGIEFDRKISNVAPFSKGSVSAKAGLEIETVQGGEFIYQYFKSDFVYTTDFEGKATVYGFESMWQPIANTLPIGKNWALSEKYGVWIYFAPTLNVDYFHVGDNGTFTTLQKGDDYLWAGTKVAAKLFFSDGFLKPISLSAKYFFLYEILHGGTKNIHFQQYSANYKLVELDQGSIGLEARYTVGNTPRTLERQDELYLGLTVKLGELQPEPKTK